MPRLILGTLFGAMASVLLGGAGALAQTAEKPSSLTIGYTSSTDSTGLFVAAEQGFFKKHDLDVKLQLISLNSILPAALQSNSVQIAGPSVSVVLQAVENGLDLVAITGGASTSKDATNYAVLSGSASGINHPEDLIGKKIGVPGLGATLHILGREWLRGLKLDYRKVTFIEVPFTQMNDVLKAGTVDAVISADPMTARILQSGTGKLLSYFLKDVPAGLPTSVYTTTRSWAQANPAAVNQFRAALQDAADFIQSNPVEARNAVSKYIKFPPEILEKTYLPRIVVPLTPDRLEWWIGVMTEQEMLKKPPAVNALMNP
jgi:NitT/TauT family transport system substrate-binding protein